MIDFTNAIEELNLYKGSEKKKTLVYNGKKYLVKFPDPIRQKNKQISYINNAFSEYVGSNIFKICGMEAQNTILGYYQYQGKNKIVCACEDFTDPENILYEFENLSLSTNLDKKIDTEISDIMKVLDENNHLIEVKKVKEKFWDMFIIDSIIGNTDRHNGNWGFLFNKKIGKATFSKVYDCGSCLNPLLEDHEIENIDEIETKNIAQNTYSCLKENGKKINYMCYIKELKNIECRDALVRMFPKINLEAIQTFIQNIEGLSNIRKKFYQNMIKKRYQILKEIYQKVAI